MNPGSEEASADPVDPRSVRGLVLLTLIAGMIDAVTFLGLGQVFAANMTGNLVVLGVAIAGAPGLAIGGPAVALAAFLVGAAVAGRRERPEISRHAYLVRLVHIEIVAIAVAAGLALWLDPGEDWLRYSIIAVLAGAMGVRNETIRRIDFPELRTTVLTLAIAGFAAHEAERRRSVGDRLRFAGIVAMLTGALVSALLVLNASLAWALAATLAAEAVAMLVLGRGSTARGATVRQ